MVSRDTQSHGTSQCHVRDVTISRVIMQDCDIVEATCHRHKIPEADPTNSLHLKRLEPKGPLVEWQCPYSWACSLIWPPYDQNDRQSRMALLAQTSAPASIV